MLVPRLCFSMNFNLGMGTSSSSPIEPTDPLDILIVGDLSGRSSRGVIEPLAGRSRIEVDDADGLCARLAPKIAVAGIELSPTSLDDFHADHLQRHPAGNAAPATSTNTPTPTEPPKPAPSESGSAFGDLLGSEANAKPADAVQDAVSKMIASAMGGASKATPDTPASIDHAWLRSVLADPGFREAELAWRALHWFETRVEVGEHARLLALDASAAEVRTAIDDGGVDALTEALFADRPPSDPPALVVLLDTFAATADDLARLRQLGSAASAAGVPVVAGIDPAIFGCHGIAETPDSTAWDAQSIDADVRDAWAELCESDAGRALVLAAPRVLLRAPYGSETEPTDVPGFAEVPLDAPPPHELLCWAPGSLAAGVAIAAGLGVAGRGIRLAGAAEVDQLPMHTFTVDRDQHVVPPAETWLSDRALEHISGFGLTPIGSLRHRDAARVGPIRSLAGDVRAWWQRG